ncbi:hypothetical protein [Brasilonema sp. UFV-L1]|uniref:hypothetical protein n=1 Tax=Brasilonema sp. UFV-L1 TaxID=2234130 RepID=UPI00145F3F01|nr:hypothetical protein [Brasilonema sp. UFV-L1]NMG10681.1 hypothetical protein [Brasilonema sp. UFV-L1]
MLAQFQSKYPQGSLISELVQIYHGKYIVRASVQIDGVTRATGMAAAEILEEAEDKARNRALVVLGINTSSQDSVVTSSEPVKPVQSTLTTTSSRFNESAYSPTLNTFPQTQTTPTPPFISSGVDQNQMKNQDISERFSRTDKQETPFFESSSENLGMMSDYQGENHTIPEMTPSNVTPFVSRSYNNSSEDFSTQTSTGRKKKKSEPVDQSDDIAKIGVEMQRLGWTTEQGRDYLIKTYNKRSRHLLTDEELHDFLRYLESQPTPPDPLAGF